MTKIIQFPVMPSFAVSGNTGFETPVKQDNPPPPRRKEPIVISVMPDKAFPVGHRDLRPLLQRDGLILLSWAIWEDWEGDDSLELRYVVTWVVSSGKHRHYATEPILKSELAGSKPERRGDPHFYRGMYERYSRSNLADYVYLTAPYDLNKKTIPAFVQELKKAGIPSNFDFPYTMDHIKKLEFAEKYMEVHYSARGGFYEL